MTSNRRIKIIVYVLLLSFSSVNAEDSQSKSNISSSKLKREKLYRVIDREQYKKLDEGFDLLLKQPFKSSSIQILERYYTVDQSILILPSSPKPSLLTKREWVSVSKISVAKERSNTLHLESEQASHLFSIDLKSKEEFGWGEFHLSLQKLGKDNPLYFLQVPHRYFDRHTYDIGLDWWNSGLIKAFMANDIHRNAKTKVRRVQQSTDFSSVRLNPMVAATRGFVNHLSNAYVIQLHGFERSKRRTSRGKSADVILSFGEKLPRKLLEPLFRVKQCLNSRLGFDAKVYPQEVNELGATKNVVGQELKSMGLLTRFIHIEMNKMTREKLINEHELSEAFLQCIILIGE